MNDILQLDYSLFHFIYSATKNECSDIIMPILRDRYTWIPMYFILLIYIIFKQSWTKGGVIIIGLVMTIGFADFVSSQLIKKSIKRPRPCHHNAYSQPIDSIVTCGKGYSFPSSHASNHFALAFYLILIGLIRRPSLKIGFLFWAFIISYAQVYVGLHYPFDILGGLLLGYFLSLIFSIIIRKVLSLLGD